MKKLTYDQVIEKIEESTKCKNILPFPLNDVIKAIVNSFNDNIEDHNNKNYICNKCDAYMGWVKQKENCNPPINVYKCVDCGEIVEYRNNERICDCPKTNPNGDQP